MPKSGLNVALKGLDDIFSTEESRQEEQREQVQQIPVSELFPFKNHPFKVLDDDSMTRTVESISQFGVLAPLIARPRPEGGYEIISGHRRKHAAELANLDTVPVIVRNMEDDAATILMVDSNLQREHILPSERAFAYKMKLDAIKNQGARSDLTSSQVGTKLRADEKVAKDSGESRNQVQRFVRLTNLVPELLDMVDEKKISFNPAVELSYLDEKQQQDFLEAMDASQNAPSLSQAIRIKKLAQQGEFDYDAVYNIMNEEKKSELDTVTIKNETLRKYFPRNYTPRQMESIIIKLLDQWQLKKQQANELLWKLEKEIPDSSWSADLEAGSDFKEGNTRCSVRVFERYSMMGGNRLSLTLTMFQNGDNPIRLSAITAGGSQAVFFKINTIGEESFLDDVKNLLEEILEE